MGVYLLERVRHLVHTVVSGVQRRLLRWTRPATCRSLVLGTTADSVRRRSELVAENALLRQQPIVLTRTAKRPHIARSDRPLLVLLASRVRAWRQALLIVQPATPLRWHREVVGSPGGGGRRHAAGRRASRPRRSRSSGGWLGNNRLRGAERIQGELAKLGIRRSKRTIQKYLRRARPRPPGQTWATFLRNHAGETWACDFLQLTDAFFRPLFAFFIVELGSRRVVHVGVTRSPTKAWAAQQLREATPEGSGPRFLVHDHDAKYGPEFDRLAAATRIEVIRTPIRAPRANAVCERFLGSVQRECADQVLILGEQHVRRVFAEYVAHFNQGRPHQGIGQRIPTSSATAPPPSTPQIRQGAIGVPILGGLHHEYRWAA
jgi:putative transposase